MYKYTEIKERLFSDDGQRMFLEIRDKTQKLLKQSGAVRLAEIISHVSGDTWTMLACIDRMIELGEIREIPQGEVSAQARIFVRARSLE